MSDGNHNTPTSTTISPSQILQWINTLRGQEKVMLRIDNATMGFPSAFRMLMAVEQIIRDKHHD